MRRSALRFASLSTLALLSAAAIGACGGAETITFDTTGTGGGGTGGGATGGEAGSNPTGGSGGVAGGGGSVGGSGGGIGGTAGGGGGIGGTGGVPASCGDGQAQPNEVCDGADLKGATCQVLGYSSPDGLTCTPTCILDSSGCAATCDGALLEPGEACDGASLGGHDCTEYGYVNGAGLACNDTCDGFDPKDCAAACNGKIEPGEACDGADVNGHDCTEFGFVNPGGLACVACALDASGCKPECGNNKVEPGEACDDGNLVNGDGCSATCTVDGGTTCANALPVSLGLGTQTFTGTTVAGGAHNGLCASAGPDRIYAVTVQSAGFLTASLTRANTSYSSVLYARSNCDNSGSEILCADSKDPMNQEALKGGEVVSFAVNQGQVVYLFVDGATANDAGNYELVIDLSVGTNCQDPIPVRIEAGTPMRLLGTTNGKSQSGGGSCGGGVQGFGSEDVVYNLQFGTAGQSTIALDAAGTGYNSVLYLRNECNNGFAEISCDNAGGNGGESLNVNAAVNTSVWTWVDGSQGANGNYALVVTPVP